MIFMMNLESLARCFRDLGIKETNTRSTIRVTGASFLLIQSFLLPKLGSSVLEPDLSLYGMHDMREKREQSEENNKKVS
jgi:hypothetical protein